MSIVLVRGIDGQGKEVNLTEYQDLGIKQEEAIWWGENVSLEGVYLSPSQKEIIIYTITHNTGNNDSIKDYYIAGEDEIYYIAFSTNHPELLDLLPSSEMQRIEKKDNTEDAKNITLVIDIDKTPKQVDLNKCRNLHIRIPNGIWAQEAILEEVFVAPGNKVILHAIWGKPLSDCSMEGYFVANNEEIVNIISITQNKELLSCLPEL